MTPEHQQQHTAAGLPHAPKDDYATVTVPTPGPCTISFENLVYSIPEPLTSLRRLPRPGQSRPRKSILRGLSGICRAGELTAILGPTGGGKSTLLDVLAGRKTLDSGVVLLNGQSPGTDFRRLTGYCEQEDCLLGTLTVRETLQFSAELRLPASFSSSSSSSFSYPSASASSKESTDINKRAASIRARVSAVIKELGLEACADSLVGTEFLRGLSGGEKKRTNLGRELVTAPSIIFMDEPTTGLDSQTAGTVVDILSRLASHQNKTIVLSIHQPKFSIFKRFHSLILLHEGKVAYAGRAEGGEGYFQRLGYQKEDSNNPADWFVELLTTTANSGGGGGKEGGREGGEEGDVELALRVAAEKTAYEGGREGAEEEEESKQLVIEVQEGGREGTQVYQVRQQKKQEMTKPASTSSPATSASSAFSSSPPSSLPSSSSSYLTDLYLQSPEYQTLLFELALLKNTPSPSSSTSSSTSSSFSSSSSFATTLTHQIRVLSRRTILCSLRNPASALMQFAAMFFFVALIGGIYWKMDLGPQGLQNRVGAFFILIMMCMFSNISALELFIEERGVFLHEKANGCYRPAAYFWAKSLCDIVPLRVIPAVLFCTAVYPMMGLRSGFEHWFLFTATVILSMLSAAALCLMVSSWIPIFAVANLGVALIFILFLITGGVLINFEQLPAWLLPFKYVSIFRYAMEVLSVNEMTGMVFECPAGSPAGCVGGKGDGYLALQHYPRYEDLWINLLAISAIFVGCMGLTFVSLRRIQLR